jgi:transposase-like protein
MVRNRRQRTVAHVADDPGVNTDQLHRWAAKYEHAEVAKRNDRGETLEEENRRLRKENERLRMEKAIPKEAAAFG